VKNIFFDQQMQKRERVISFVNHAYDLMDNQKTGRRLSLFRIAFFIP
jgi:hypothetical protein